MTRALVLAAAVGALAVGPAAAQRLTIGPLGVMADYKEVDVGLRYSGWGYGGTAMAQWRKLSAEVAVVRLSLDPTTGSSAPAGFKATQLDAWIGYAVSPYASLEVGLARRLLRPRSARCPGAPAPRSAAPLASAGSRSP